MIDNLIRYTSAQFKMRDNGLMQVLLGNMVVLSTLMAGRFVLRLLGHDDIYQIFESGMCMPSSWVEFVNKPWSILTYLFVQRGFMQILWSTLLLYTFGRIILNFMSSRHFVILYFFGGIVGACVVMLLYNTLPRFRGEHTEIYGIDSCVYAIVAALYTMSPNYPFRLLLLGNVKLKHIFFIFLFTAFCRLDEGNAIGICQLGGALGGYLYIKIISKIKLNPIFHFKKVFRKRPRIVVIKNQNIHDNVEYKN